MYKASYIELRKNGKSFILIQEPGMNKHIHWLNPLLFKRKSR